MAYKTRAGDLREQITLRAPTGAVDADYGGETGAFADFATVWAKPIVRTGRERVEMQSLNAVNTITFMIRYLSGVSAAMVAVYRGVTYKILTITETDYREFLAIDCEARDVSTN
jgi:SPP1 family predicted phage head-tail adaptor